MLSRLLRHALPTLVLAFLGSFAAGDERAPAPAAKNQPQAATAEGANLKRSVVPIRNGAAADLAGVLTEHFKDEPSVRFVVEPGSNTLLVTANPRIHPEVMETLAALDRPRARVTIDAVVLELAEELGKDGKADPDQAGSDDRKFTGSIDAVNARIEALQKAGKIVNVKRMRAEGLENQEAQMQAGEEVSIPNGFNVNARTGLAAPIIQRRAVGTIIQMTPRVTIRNEVIAALLFRDDRVQYPPDAVVLFKGGENGPIISPVVASSLVKASVKLTPGQAVVLNGLQTEASGKVNRLVVVLVARIEKPDPDK